jgi:hypothetical protein
LPFPEPEPGLVIRYAYLWRSEADRGQDEGTKDRPCAVVLATRREADRKVVAVAPITHVRPAGPYQGLEIPQATKTRLGLDYERSWIITHEVNVFIWPGHDLRPVDHNNPSRGFAYGHLPGGLTKAMIESVRQLMRDGQAKPVNRDE